MTGLSPKWARGSKRVKANRDLDAPERTAILLLRVKYEAPLAIYRSTVKKAVECTQGGGCDRFSALLFFLDNRVAKGLTSNMIIRCFRKRLVEVERSLPNLPCST